MAFVSEVAGTAPLPVSVPPAPTVRVEFVIEPETPSVAPGETTKGPENVEVPCSERDWSVWTTTDPEPAIDPEMNAPPSSVSVWPFRSIVPPTFAPRNVCEAPRVVGTFHPPAKPVRPPFNTTALPVTEKEPSGALADCSVRPAMSLVMTGWTAPR